MKAKHSETMTGAKSVPLKPFDPLFKKEIPARSFQSRSGTTSENPIFGVSIFRKTFKKDLDAQKQQR